MRKLVYATSLSLDGYIDTDAGDPSWVVPDEELHRHFNEIERETDTLLYGRRMYELMAGYWPTADQDPSAPAVIVEYAQFWKPISKVVFSSTLESVDWNSLRSMYLLWSDRFYPVDFDDWSIVVTQLELPRGFRVFAPGRRVLAVDRGTLHVERFETSQPVRAVSIVADARWLETERTVGGRRMRTLLHPASHAYAEQILRTSADVLSFYASRFGPYAFDQFTFATVDGIFARRALAGGVIYNPRYLADELRATGHDAHETALLWWFYTIAGRGPGSYQWTEGFGDYAEMLYDEARGLPIPPDFESYRRGYLRMAGTPDEPPITSPRGPLAGNFVHGRLPWVMHLLRFAVGDTAFDRGIRVLFDRWRFRTFTLEEFVTTLAEGTGQPLDWWRREWLERGGVPELIWHAEIEPDSGGHRVTVSIRQAGALYTLPIEIEIESAEGRRIERVQLADPAGQFRFWFVSKPTRVVVDPRRWLLAKITAQ